jgi:hypothetical protein
MKQPLKLFVGDGARESDAAEMRKLLHGLDLMHERGEGTKAPVCAAKPSHNLTRSS